MSEVVTSLNNPLIKRLRKLRHRKFRTAEQVFLIEGIAQVRQAIDHNAPLEQLLVAPDLLTSGPALDAVEEQAARGVPVVKLGRDAFESITERDHPSGLAATARMQERSLTDLAAAPGRFYVGLHDVHNPGNLGSIIRTAEAVGGGGVIVVGEATDQYHPQAVKASMGTLFAIPVYRSDTLDDLFAWTMMEDVPVVATSARAEVSFWDAEYALPSLFLFGGEALGLPDDAIERSTMTVTMPMEGTASSLNLSVAAGVMLYELKRRARL